MKMQSENVMLNTRALCSSESKDTGGHEQEEINVQSADNCSCCAKCRRRIQIITFCSLCVVIISMCCVTIGYTNHACALTKETFNSRFLNLEQKLNRLQKKYLITKVSNLMTQRDSIIQRQNLGDNQSDGSSMDTNIPEEINTVKRSVNKCDRARNEKKRLKCLKRQKRKKKQMPTGSSLVRLVNNTIHKTLMETVKQVVAKAMEKRALLSVHFEGDGNEHRPREAFAGRFHKWQYSDWAYQREDLKKKFKLYHESGTVVISEEGIYLLYAQVTLMGKPDQGFKVVVQHDNKQQKILTKCMMDFQSEQDGGQDLNEWQEDGNITCSSVGVFRLEKGDSVFLKHSKDTNVKADFRGNASFFGFVKLG
ncbi:uncharacterized protein LOC117342183 isoform X3 [Pecten maximus]|uniref:uncharacterized protein LOC117342183 isoform X3 n=1 Tax=Pecten maximus TaxID=6579 RepID=UPI0014582C04|nr:uncharacterized protein LOC117342183 isoform X3 [Pecten maximus]